MYKYNATIVRVVDGDTVDVDIDLGFNMWLRNQRIRLAGIDTPESRTKDKEEKFYGIAAKNFLKTLLHEGEVYELETTEKGKFGRYLGTFECEVGDVCETMLKCNQAVKYEGQNKSAIKRAHRANWKVLREKGVGYVKLG